LVGGEESGGFSIRGHIREKDGVLMGLLGAAIASEEPFDDRVDSLLAEHGDIVLDKTSVECPDSEKERVLSELEGELPETVAGREIAKVVTIDGFKLLLDDGSWLLVRPSGTEPLLRIYAEASNRSSEPADLPTSRPPDRRPDSPSPQASDWAPQAEERLPPGGAGS
jgi:phosphomannomutase